MSRARNYLFILVAALVTGCGLSGGTEAGNPTIGAAPTSDNPVSGRFAQYLLDTVCSKYTECYQTASTANCQAGVLQQTNIPGGFGLSSSFGTAKGMVDAEKAGTIHADYIHVANCEREIRLLSCASPLVGAAAPMGSANTAAAYTGVINMIPTSGTSCPGVF